MLRELQVAFVDSIFSGRNSEPSAPAITGGKLSSARRLEIYRHNVFANLRGALRDIFPVVERIVGEAFFQHAADQFIRETPSTSGDLNQFGRQWPAFLGNYPHARELPYLADVASLEWAWHACFHAADAAALDIDRLAAIDATDHGALIFKLHPGVRLVFSEYPVLQMWRVNQPEYAGEMGVDWDQAGEYLLVRRDVDEQGTMGVDIQAVSIGASRFMRALEVGCTLETAATLALDADAAFDLQVFLIESVQSGIITDFKKA